MIESLSNTKICSKCKSRNWHHYKRTTFAGTETWILCLDCKHESCESVLTTRSTIGTTLNYEHYKINNNEQF